MGQPPRPRNHRGGRRLRRPNWCSWIDRSPLLLPFLLLLLFTFSGLSCADFSPADNFLLNCGATNPAVPEEGGDNRNFHPDGASLPSSVSINLDGSVARTNPDTSAPALYRTARSFPRSSSYQFTIANTSSSLVVRLHFYPFSNLSSSIFSVSASGFTLLSRFAATGNSFPIIREFYLKPGRDSLTLSFSPDPPSTLAFVSAIEVFSAPSALILQQATRLTAGAGAQTLSGLDDQVLETLYRVNVGGLKVTPSNDSLWRTWLPDDADAAAVYKSRSPGVAISKINSVKYVDGGSTLEVAPPSVYGTARAMYNPSASDNGSAALRFNLSWAVNVDPGQGQFLVRMHYCDIVSAALNEFLINSYINNQMASGDLDISTKTLNQLATPGYEDFVVASDGSGTLRVDVGPSTSSRSKINAFLNGLEVFAVKGRGQFSDSGSSNKKGNSTAVVIGAVVGALVVVGVVAGIIFMFRRKKGAGKKRKKPTTPSPAYFPTSSWPSITSGTERGSKWSEGTPVHINFELRISYEVILRATNSFAQEAVIGSGGFGKVYKGKLPDDGRVIAVKRGKPGSQHGPQQFHSEILILSKTRHRHLVSFIGYCDERGEMILVYEFMEKGTLQSHLYGSRNINPCLSWKQRLQILIGAAQGLDYLHTGQEPGIIHRDVKSANILLDGNYVAKVADFGISKLGPAANSAPSSANNTGTSVVKGTFGYLDPEYFRTQQLTNKSDVYSFGVVLLEAACARAALVKTLPDDEVSLAEWGLKWIKLGMFIEIVDPRIKDEIDSNSLRAFSAIAEKCLASQGNDRPTMNDVLWNLNYALTLQENSTRSVSLEDSVVGSSVANVSIIQPFPVTNMGRAEGNGPRRNTRSETSDLTSSTTDVFSQLITKDGR